MLDHIRSDSVNEVPPIIPLSNSKSLGYNYKTIGMSSSAPAHATCYQTNQSIHIENKTSLSSINAKTISTCGGTMNNLSTDKLMMPIDSIKLV